MTKREDAAHVIQFARRLCLSTFMLRNVQNTIKAPTSLITSSLIETALR